MSKFTIMMQTPDCLHYALQDLPEEERAEALEVCKKWFKYGEMIKLKVDTETKTCVVLEQ